MQRFIYGALCALALTLACSFTASAQLTEDQQMAAAVSPAPENLRAEATVLGYNEDGELVTLREGTNELICLADDPSEDRFHVACYHESLEPFMARGRELRAEGKSRAEVQDTREAEARAGTLVMPEQSAALYSLTGETDAYDYETGTVKEARPLYVVYIPYATEETTGLATSPVTEGAPWIMDPGKPWAHIMVVTGQPRSDQ